MRWAVWLRRARRAVRAALLALPALLVFGPPSARGLEADAEAEHRALPGRIYIVAPIPRDVMHGLLAVDPNERTCATIDELANRTARVAPGGRQYVYSKFDPATRKTSVFHVSQDGDPRPIQTFDMLVLPVASWSRDGDELTLSLMGQEIPADQPRNWRVKADGSARTKLGVPSTDLIWDRSPDGDWVVASSGRRSDANDVAPEFPYQPIYVMRPDGTAATQVVPPGARAKAGLGGTMNAAITGFPRFSPDGRHLLYIRGTTELDAETRRLTKHESKLWVVGRDGRDRRLVFEGTDEEGYPYSAAWSPDGRAIAIGLQKPRGENAQGPPEPRLLIVDADGKNPREIPLPQPTLINVVDWR